MLPRANLMMALVLSLAAARLAAALRLRLSAGLSTLISAPKGQVLIKGSSKSATLSMSATRATMDKTMSLVKTRVNALAPRLVQGLRDDGFFVSDGFLGHSLIKTLRAEASKLYKTGRMDKSQSARWCPVEKRPILYDKHNVFATQLMGGEMYDEAPRLHEYTVALVRSLVPHINQAFPEALLSEKLASNKLAVCVGDGSAYDKHYDNEGLSDTRKVTFLLYMNQNWRPENGGVFRIYNSADSAAGPTTDISPIADRILCFWSDRLVHSVEPSFAQRGESDHRYALTVWLTSTSVSAIARDDDMVKLHFGS